MRRIQVGGIKLFVALVSTEISTVIRQVFQVQWSSINTTNTTLVNSPSTVSRYVTGSCFWQKKSINSIHDEQTVL